MGIYFENNGHILLELGNRIMGKIKKIIYQGLPQIHKVYSIKTYSYKIQKYWKCNVVGMAEQISKKHRHQVIMSSNVTDLGAMTSVPAIVALANIICWTLVMAPKSVTFQWHDHLVSVLFGDLLTHSYSILH